MTPEPTAPIAAAQVQIVGVPIVPPVKPGWRSTEFWFALGAAVLPHIIQVVPQPWGWVISALASFGYSQSRGMAKRPL